MDYFLSKKCINKILSLAVRRLMIIASFTQNRLHQCYANLRLCVKTSPTKTLKLTLLNPKQSPSMLCVSAPLGEKPPLTNTPRLTLLNPEYPSSSRLCISASLRDPPLSPNVIKLSSKRLAYRLYGIFF